MRNETRTQRNCSFIRRRDEGFSQVRRLPNGNKSGAELPELPTELNGLLVIPGQDTIPRPNEGLLLQLAKQVTRSNSVKDFFEYNCQFWDSIFSKAQRPVLGEVFRQLEDRMARYYPLLLKLFPKPETRPRPSESLIEIYRKGKIAEAFRAFRKIYLEIVDQVIDHLKGEEVVDSSRRSRSTARMSN